MENVDFRTKISELIHNLNIARSIKDQITEEHPNNLSDEIQKKLIQLDELIKEIEMQLSFIS